AVVQRVEQRPWMQVIIMRVDAGERRAFPPRAADDLSRLRSRVFSVLQHLDTIDQHISNAGSVLVRFGKGRMVLDAGGIEDYDVGKVSRLERAATVDFEILRRQAREPSHSLFQRQQFLIAHITAQEPRKIAKSAWMRI